MAAKLSGGVGVLGKHGVSKTEESFVFVKSMTCFTGDPMYSGLSEVRLMRDILHMVPFELFHLGKEFLVGSIIASAALHDAHAVDIAVLGQENVLCLFSLPLLGLPSVRALHDSGLNHSKNPYAHATSLRCQFQ